MLESQIENARVASRGQVDYDHIVRSSLYKDEKGKPSRTQAIRNSHNTGNYPGSPDKALSKGYTKFADSTGVLRKSNQPYSKIHSPQRHGNSSQADRGGLRTASQNIRPSRLGLSFNRFRANHNASQNSSLLSDGGNARSEYGVEDVNDLDRLSQIQYDDNDKEERDTIAAL